MNKLTSKANTRRSSKTDLRGGLQVHSCDAQVREPAEGVVAAAHVQHLQRGRGGGTGGAIMSATRQLLSATQQLLSATQQMLSVTRQLLSATRQLLSVTRQLLSAAEGCLPILLASRALPSSSPEVVADGSVAPGYAAVASLRGLEVGGGGGLFII